MRGGGSGAPSPDTFSPQSGWDAFGGVTGFDDQQKSNNNASESNPSLDLHVGAVGSQHHHGKMKQRPSISNNSGNSSVFPTAVTSSSRSTAATSLSRSTEATSLMKNTTRSKKRGGMSPYGQSSEFQMSGLTHGSDWLASDQPGPVGITEVLHEVAGEAGSPTAKKKKKKKEKGTKKSKKAGKAAKHGAHASETASQKAARKAMKKAKKEAAAAVGEEVRENVIIEGGSSSSGGLTGPIREGVELWVPASPFTAATVHTTASSGGRSSRGSQSSSNPASTSQSGLLQSQSGFSPIMEGPHESPAGDGIRRLPQLGGQSYAQPLREEEDQSRVKPADTNGVARFNSGESVESGGFFDDDVSALTFGGASQSTKVHMASSVAEVSALTFGGASQSTKIHMGSVAGESHARSANVKQERLSPPLPPVGPAAGTGASRHASRSPQQGGASKNPTSGKQRTEAKSSSQELPHSSGQGGRPPLPPGTGPRRSNLRQSNYEQADEPGAVQMSSRPIGAPPLRSAMRRTSPSTNTLGSHSSSRSSRRLAHVEPVGIPAAMTVSDELIVAERIQTPFETSQKEEVKRPKKWLILGIVIALVAIAGASAGIALKSKSGAQAAPTTAPSAMPTVNLDDFIETFGGVAGAAIEDSSSPQYQAIFWMANSDAVEELDLDLLLQRYVVTTVYFALTRLSNESEVSNLESWLDPEKHECDWERITCADGAAGARIITALNLTRLGLDGCIPPDIGFLGGLESLHLGENRIYGLIPTELARLTSLRDLNIERNDLVGVIPRQMGNMTNLESLDMSHNILKGKIPDEIYQLTKLTVFDISFNVLAGSFSEHFAGMEKLQVLNIRNNRLESTIPPIFHRLTDLVELHYDYNQIYGEIPDQVDFLTKRETLTGSYNYLTGIIPSKAPPLGSPEYMQLEQEAQNGAFRLQEATMSGNFHSGTIPVVISALPSIRDLQFADNIFEGVVHGFPGSGLLKLAYEYNFFNSTLPLFFASSLTHLSLSGNMFQGTIPTVLGTLSALELLDVGQNPGLNGVAPSVFSPALRSLGLANCSIQGPIPETLGELTNLEHLDMRRNRFDGPIPRSFRKLTSLKSLLLSDNELTGTLPAFLGINTTDLERLLLNNNEFEGTFPPGLSELTKLTEFTAHGNQKLSGQLEGVCPAPSMDKPIFIQVDCGVLCDCCTVDNGDGSCETPP